MSNPATHILADTITWNSLTWNADSGGPIRVRLRRGARPIKDRTGADLYSRQVFLVEGELEVRIALRDAPIIALGTKSNMSIGYKTKSTDKTRNAAGMKYIGTEESQDKDNLGEEEAVFVDESTDGVTDPLS
jgi:hypothetical protein